MTRGEEKSVSSGDGVAVRASGGRSLRAVDRQVCLVTGFQQRPLPWVTDTGPVRQTLRRSVLGGIR